MQDQPMVRIQSEGLGNGLLKLELDPQHVLAWREPRPIADPEDVRVHGKRRFAERGVENDVCRLSAHAR